MQTSLLRPLRRLGVVRCPRRQRLDALALVLAEDSHRVERERCSTTFLAQTRADSLEVRLQTNDPLSIQLVRHPPRISCLGSDGKLSCSSAKGGSRRKACTEVLVTRSPSTEIGQRCILRI